MQGNDTEWFYDGDGNLTKVAAMGRDDTLLAYDGMNRLTKMSSSGNNEAQTRTYDLLGRVSTTSTASGGSMSYAYDEWHRVTANGETTSYTCDSYGNPSTVTDPQSRVTTYHYGAAQRITKVVCRERRIVKRGHGRSRYLACASPYE